MGWCRKWGFLSEHQQKLIRPEEYCNKYIGQVLSKSNELIFTEIWRNHGWMDGQGYSTHLNSSKKYSESTDLCHVKFEEGETIWWNSVAICKILNSCRNLTKTCTFEVKTMSADGLVPYSAGPSAGTKLTHFQPYTYEYIWSVLRGFKEKQKYKVHRLRFIYGHPPRRCIPCMSTWWIRQGWVTNNKRSIYHTGR